MCSLRGRELTREASECDHVLRQQDPFAALNEARLAFDRHAGGGPASCRRRLPRGVRDPRLASEPDAVHDEDRADAQQYAGSSMGTSSLRSVAGRAGTACSRLAAPCHRPLLPAPPTDRLRAGRRPERPEERGGAVPFGAARTTAVPRPSGEWEASSSPPSTGFSGPPSTGLFRPAGCSGRDGLELVLVEAASPSRCPVQAAPVRPPSCARVWKEGARCTPCGRRGRLLRQPQASPSAGS